MQNNFALATLKLLKSQEEVRGLQFAKDLKRLMDLMGRVFDRQKVDVLAYIDNNPHLFAGENGMIIQKSDFFSPWNELEQKDLGKILYSWFIEWQSATNTDVQGEIFGIIGIDDTNAKKYISSRTGDLISLVDDTTRKGVRSIIEKGFSEHKNQREIAGEIQSTFQDFWQYRSGLIANMELSLAYEGGKKSQFDSYVARYGFKGWKRSQTQHDSNVRFEHTQNEIDGWIPEDQIFSGTKTDSAPHGFRCRCTIFRRLTEPTQEMHARTQFVSDRAAYMSVGFKKLVIDSTQDFRRKFPFLDKPQILSDFQDAQEGFIAGIHYQWKIAFNAVEEQYDKLGEGMVADGLNTTDKKRATIYHELGHYLDYWISKNKTKSGNINGYPFSEIEKMKENAKEKTLTNWKFWRTPWSAYAEYTEKTRWLSMAQKEVFAECVTSYMLGIKSDILSDEMKNLLYLLTYDTNAH